MTYCHEGKSKHTNIKGHRDPINCYGTYLETTYISGNEGKPYNRERNRTRVHNSKQWRYKREGHIAPGICDGKHDKTTYSDDKNPISEIAELDNIGDRPINKLKNFKKWKYKRKGYIVPGRCDGKHDKTTYGGDKSPIAGKAEETKMTYCHEDNRKCKKRK
eukprot:11596429-Heterocapsa_arctica.AAC.1